MPTAAQPKHRQVFQSLVKEIHSGRLKRGDRLPSEAELVRTYGASRITVGRAVRDLQAQGLVERRVGSGTYVSAPQAPGALSFGLLIPELGETDIFEPVCQGMMASPLARNHALVWGSVSGEALSREDRAWQLCEQYIERRVSGVFFAPLEFTAAELDINQRIAAALDAARIPVVLLDRTVTPYPHRGHHDLVGIDNRRAGFIVTEPRSASRQPPCRVRRRSPMPRQQSTRARLAIARRCSLPICPSTVSSFAASTPRTIPLCVRSCRRHLTPSSAPTIALRRG